MDFGSGQLPEKTSRVPSRLVQLMLKPTAATAIFAAGTQGSLIKLGYVDACCNHSLNYCKFGLVDLLNPCIFRVPVNCKSQTFSVFFI